MTYRLSAADAAHVNAALELPEQPAYDWTDVLQPDVICGCCGGPVPEPGLWLVQRPDGPRDACGQACAQDLDGRTRR